MTINYQFGDVDAHGALIRAQAASLEAEHQAIEEFAPAAGAFDEQAIHRRRQPDHLHNIAEIGGALGLDAVQADMTSFTAAGGEPDAALDIDV